MIKHIVCMKLKDQSIESQNYVKELLLSMKGKVPTIVDIEVNLDELRSERSYDIILSVIVESWEKLDLYQKDSYHCDVVKAYLFKNSTSLIALDYKC